MSKYAPLTEYFLRQSVDYHELTMSFGKIEKLLGAKLPKTAKTDRPWWANTYRNNQGSRWLKAGWKVFRVDLINERIVFQRHQSDNKKDKKKARTQGYAKLKRFFESLSPKQEQIDLTFSELGKIMGRRLPTTAYHDRPWWANTYASIQGSSWLSAEWLVENVYLEAKITVFRKRGISPVKRIPKYVKHLLDKNVSINLIDSQTLINWINFCRKVGWYFEGTVLYERGGLSTDSLNEIDQVAVEEDYATCKRELSHHKTLMKQSATDGG